MNSALLLVQEFRQSFCSLQPAVVSKVLHRPIITVKGIGFGPSLEGI